MVRRKSKALIEPQTIVLTLLALGGLWILARILSSPVFLQTVGSLLLVALLGGAAVFVFVIGQGKQSRRTASEKAQQIINKHVRTLAKDRVQLMRTDDYGKKYSDKWDKAKGQFIGNHIMPELRPGQQKALHKVMPSVLAMIDASVEAAIREQPVFGRFSDEMTPTEFEHFCAEELRRDGWDARVTLRSRDQGIDIVAEKNRVRLVLQCKLYTGSVGNKSVQEAAAGKAHEQAQYGIVVTNSRYTADAKQLAQTNGVLLLHWSELHDLSSRLH